MATPAEVNSRLLANVRDEPKQMLKPISGYEQEPLLSLEEACQPLENILDNELKQNIIIAKMNSAKPAHGLSEDESASIHLYTMDWNQRENSLYAVLNRTLRATDRNKLRPWFKYLKLFLTAFFKLPPTEYQIVWRGVPQDLSDLYPSGEEQAWWSLSSCTSTIGVLESPFYLGKSGIRTMFSIETRNGKLIRSHSYFQNEDEILLPPGTFLKVVGTLNPADGLHIIHLREISPPYEMLAKPFDLAQLKQALPPSKPLSTEKHSPEPKAAPMASVPPPSKTEPNQHRNPQLEQKIQQSTPRSWMDLRNMKLNDRDIDIVSQLAIHNKQCKQLSLDHNEITSVGASILAEALNNNNTLERLYLGGNRVSDSGVESLAKTLTNNNHTLKELALDSTGMTDSGCEHLAQMLKTNQTLTFLSLSSNEISNRGIQVLCQAIKHHNNSLQSLSLSRHKLLTDASVNSLQDVIKYHRSLWTLDVSWCNLSLTGKERLRKAKESKKVFLLSV